MYISNSSTTKNGGYVCYHHTGPNLPSKTENVNCNHLGKYVIIYNERNKSASNNPTGYSSFAILELCDVQVFGKFMYRFYFALQLKNELTFYFLVVI